ncbi:TPA: hypothetical protein ACH3X2_014208 [Trebouxia sp. C0005]|nr:MAG: NADH dehydrogenase [ubiquinone] 1 beta subcomplex subunit mitochondrial-like [Trebouxia sp. A1-2]
MALRPATMARLSRSVMASQAMAPVRSGGGGPIALGKPAAQPLTEEDELRWDDGTAHPEYCLDQFNLVGRWEAFGMLAAGLGVFGLVAGAASYNNKASRMPYVPREYPFDNLKEELGGFDVKGSTQH